MRTLAEMRTVEEVDLFINEITRHLPELHAKAESRQWSAAERAADMKLDAVCEALERRAVLQEKIRA